MMKGKCIKLFFIILASASLLCSCSPGSLSTEPPGASTQQVTDTPQTQDYALHPDASVPEPLVPADEILQVVFFDVGQGDCALVKTGEHTMLIDAGNAGQDTIILGYLADYGVTKLDYLVATHPHADHIGSMVGIIRAMDSIGSLIMPDALHATKAFENLLDAIEETDVSVTIPQPGDIFQMGNAKIQVIAPNGGNYADLNNYSIVLRIEYGQIVFLFTGDAEDISENEQLAAEFDVSADVLKVGHHGSNSSTSQRYLDAVSPSYAVISCGKGNSYGHPHSETVSRLEERGIILYRTDENGTISFATDGNTVTASAERIADSEVTGAVVPDITADSTVLYIGNKNSKIFHLPICGSLPAEKNRKYFYTRAKAVDSLYRPCQKCSP